MSDKQLADFIVGRILLWLQGYIGGFWGWGVAAWEAQLVSWLPHPFFLKVCC